SLHQEEHMRDGITLRGTWRRMLWIAIALPASAACSSTPSTMAPSSFDDQLDKLVAPLVYPAGGTGKTPGLVVSVVTASRSQSYFYGATKVGGTAAPVGNTIFELGSLTKVFTGLVLAQQVVDGKMALSDEAQRYLPSGAALPRFEGQAITLLDLATHS